jgi:hypothetical protein
MRLATLKNDFWELRSGEESQRQNPEAFWMPPIEQRENLKRGQAAKLIFDIETCAEDGKVELTGERMWVIVAGRCGGFYIGILDSQPASMIPSDKNYLCFGAEVPFLVEHIIDIAEPPKEYAEWQLKQNPERTWPRDN